MPIQAINDGFVSKSEGQLPLTDCGLTVEQLVDQLSTVG